MPVIKIHYFSDDLPRLQKTAKGDWIDLYCAQTMTLHAGEFALVPLGVSMQLPEGYEARTAPRSSTFKRWGILQANSVGVIDNSYCGTNDEGSCRSTPRATPCSKRATVSASSASMRCSRPSALKNATRFPTPTGGASARPACADF